MEYNFLQENRDVDKLECWETELRWEVKSNTICNLLSASFDQLALLLRTVRKLVLEKSEKKMLGKIKDR